MTALLEHSRRGSMRRTRHARPAVARSRVLHVIGALAAGGAERFVTDLIIGMRRRGVPVELACLVPRMDAVGYRWGQRLCEAGIRIHRGPAMEHVNAGTVLWLARLLRAPDVRLVHLHLFNVESAYYLSRFFHRRAYRVVRTIHDTKHPESRLYQHAFRNSDIRLTITCGKAVHQVFAELTRGVAVCVPYGIVFDSQPDHAEARARLQRSLGLDPSLTHYVQVGSHRGVSPASAQKAQDDLIAAWRRGALTQRGAVLHLLGDGILRQWLEKLARGDPNIVFHGIRTNVGAWLAACDVFVMPSRWEGLPLAAIEACGAGMPCIFSDIEPHRELRYGLSTFFPVGDIDALSRRLNERVGLRERLSDTEVQAFRGRHSIDASVSAYLESYQRIL